MYLTQRPRTPRRSEPAARCFQGDAIDPTAAVFAETSRAATTLRVHGRSSSDVALARKRLLVAVAVILFAAFPSLTFAPTAGADDRQYEEFYTPPDPLPPGQPGDLIRTEPSRLALEPSGQLGAYVGTGPGSCTAAPMLRATRSR